MIKKDGTLYKNPRNMVAGLINDADVSIYWKYVTYIRYGLANADYNFSMDKLEQLKLLPEIPYLAINASEITEELLDELYYKWGEDWEIDGLVIDINDKNIRKALGRETNNNPAYAWAYKKGWVTPTATNWIGEEWQLSKNGSFKPVILINPIEVEGVTVSRATAYNARFIVENKIGKGAILNVIRSGSVIPKIVGIVKTGIVNLPTNCPSCGSKLGWNLNMVDLACINPDCEEVKFKKFAFFFTSFSLKDFGEGIAKLIYDAGFNTVEKVLKMTINDLMNIEGLGRLSGTKFLNEIKDKISETTFDKLGHASGCFENLGSRKIKMILDGLGLSYQNLKDNYIDDYSTHEQLISKLLEIKGVSDITAQSFIQGLLEFKDFIKDLPITIKLKNEQIKTNKTMGKNDLVGMSVLFTGIRRQDLVGEIESRGGKSLSGMSKNVTHLICKDKDSTSSKMLKAIEFGITIMTVEELEEYLKNPTALNK
jgi:NAD-dependent DNA ligase